MVRRRTQHHSLIRYFRSTPTIFFYTTTIMHFTNSILAGASILGLAAASPIELDTRQSGCSSYTIINTRGTGEAQGPSAGFRTMNSNILSSKSGGKVYNTVYAADYSQNSAAGTADIVNKITTTLRTSPNECFILEGYSQGAAATVNALPKLTGTANTAVKGVWLIGDPLHKAGLTCNIDSTGGTTTLNVNGISQYPGSNSIPSGWISRTQDVCKYGDGVCDTTHGQGINAQHLSYPNDATVQSMGAKFVLGKLNA
ncbi:cutinase [Aureobasidium pullulans]|uniref:Cutinase n=1 Tax=Aureobasidium pullulans TaxID=5580 RepID=A0A4S9SWV9_AURPU|nr:cutinase [Aureobasidium pullulans]THZ98078.1 cutinase [Aureobasidium pullulans]